MDLELILNAVQCKLTEAKSQFDAGHIPACQEQLVAILFLLTEELLNGAQGKPVKPLLERSKSHGPTRTDHKSPRPGARS